MPPVQKPGRKPKPAKGITMDLPGHLLQVVILAAIYRDSGDKPDYHRIAEILQLSVTTAATYFRSAKRLIYESLKDNHSKAASGDKSKPSQGPDGSSSDGGTSDSQAMVG